MWLHIYSTLGLYSQRYGFPVIMYGCGSWTIQKAECQRIDAFFLLDEPGAHYTE